MALTNFPDGITSFGVPVIGGVGNVPLTGNWWFVNPATGSDAYDGQSPETPFQTIYAAYQAAADGNNDVIVLIGNGQTSGSARLSYANAVAANSAATSGSLIWAKNALHLIGECSPTGISNRARLAPPTSYTAATFLNGQAVASTPIVSVTGSGCIFANFQIYGGFTTGNAGMLTWVDSGNRNFYSGVHFAGQADAASAGGANSRTLVLSGGGEHVFQGCTIGIDTVQRVTTATRTVEFKSGTARNAFLGCTFPVYLATAAAGTSTLYTAGSASLDRWTKFDNCYFLNASTTSGGVAQTALVTLAASSGGSLVMGNPTTSGVTAIGADATSKGQIFLNGTTPNNGAGISVNPV